MRRRPLFYVFNMILPCFIITIVAFLGFCVPSDSGRRDLFDLYTLSILIYYLGEKVSIGVTTLLSMTVFLMLVTDSMPPNSDSLPLIGKFLSNRDMIIINSYRYFLFFCNYHCQYRYCHVSCVIEYLSSW
jgi:hypothetical protein